MQSCSYSYGNTTVFQDACNGRGACSYNGRPVRFTVGVGSCGGFLACSYDGADVLIGNNSCSGESSCQDAVKKIVIGNNACTGDRYCQHCAETCEFHRASLVRRLVSLSNSFIFSFCRPDFHQTCETNWGKSRRETIPLKVKTRACVTKGVSSLWVFNPVGVGSCTGFNSLHLPSKLEMVHALQIMLVRVAHRTSRVERKAALRHE